MIAFIKGEVASVSPNYVVIENQGIGYLIWVPSAASEQLARANGMVKLYTSMQVREDDVQLYGFLTQDDKQVFELLIGVSGIGPKGALSILSIMSADDLRFAVASADAKKIAKAPGVGNKTAQKVILELKDKLKLEDALNRQKQSEGMESSVSGSAFSSVKGEAVMALCVLGYSEAEALRAVSAVEITENTSADELLKLALKKMM